jgi:phosphate transport system substrate-binding protein
MYKPYRMTLSAAAALALAGTLGAVATPAHSQTVKLDGSSTVFPISEAMAEDFQRMKKGKVKVTVGISGTGGGFKKFCRGETDISNASRPILKKEMDECRKNGVQYLELPVAYDALTVVIHPNNSWAETMTVADLKKMWEPGAQGKVKNWKQVNPNWPDRPLALYGAGADSGTFDYFTEAINGKPKSSRGDFTASEDDNVLVQGVSRDENAIGYFGFAYYSENRDKLKAVKIAEKAGDKAVGPSMESVVDGSYQPLSRPIFIYINAKSATRPEVREFIEFYMKNADTLVREVKYVPLPAKAYAYNMDHFTKNVLGTKFGGQNKVGLTIEQLMEMEARL